MNADVSSASAAGLPRPVPAMVTTGTTPSSMVTDFFPMYGASKALAADFDADGDLDIAGIAMFADFERNPEAGFVYLENRGDLQFEAAQVPEAAGGRWLTMDTGDLDGDDDIDIVLGSFIEGPGAVPKVLMQRWVNSPPVLFLENQLK